ncbi:hypothetical protein D3C84_1167490 [compost metagenome]
MLGATEVLVAQEQHAVLEQLGADRREQAIVMDGVGEVDADQLGANVVGQLFDLHGDCPSQMTKIDEPVVLRASRSRWACTASCRA